MVLNKQDAKDELPNLHLESTIWIDSAGMIYFIRSNLVWKYDPSERSSTVISLKISKDKQDYSDYSLWGDSVGRLYIADTYNHLIRTLNLNDQTAPFITVAGNGDESIPQNGAVATSTGIGFPSQMWVNVEGHFFFADSEACNVYEVNEEGRIYKILGTGSYGGELRLGSSSGLTQIGSPVGIVGDVFGNMYVAANSVNGVIYKLSERSVKYDYKIEYFGGVRGGYSLQGSYGNGDGLLATSTHFSYVGTIGIDCHSNIYVEDAGSMVIRKIDGVSGITRIVVDEEVYNQMDFDYDDQVDDSLRPANTMFITHDGGIYLYRCSLIRFIQSNELKTAFDRSLSFPFNITESYIFIIVGISFFLLIKYKRMKKVFTWH